MKALILALTAISLLISFSAFANAKPEAAHAPEKKAGMTKAGKKGVVPALLPNIADPSSVHGGEDDPLQLKQAAAEEEAAPAAEVAAPVVKKAKPAKAAVADVPAEAPAPIAEKPATVTKVPEEIVAVPAPREQVEKLSGGALPEFPLEPEVAIILSAQRFFPARIRLKDGQATRLLFTSLNSRPAALVIEQLQVQRWIASEKGSNNGLGRVPAEILREIGNNRMTEVMLQPQRGTYTFHDALSGAVGEIVVE